MKLRCNVEENVSNKESSVTLEKISYLDNETKKARQSTHNAKDY